ncbi:MAG: hypothetical protein EU543_03975 [Promethearchaeota archaeon]|nr:MAG: hypothetical protein EU543_03975 [Candidatus Lokiarchaeota archaeon]
MPSEKKKISRVIDFMKKGLTSLADELEETVKNINSFIDSLQKAEKDLKGISIEKVTTVSTSSQQVVAPTSNAKSTAANTLFSLLSGSQAGAGIPQPATAQSSGLKAPTLGPPKAPSAGPPKAPSSGPPKAPSTGPPKKSNLPPAPKPSAGPPKAPSSGPPKAPSAGPPKAPTSGPPSTPASSGPPKAPTSAGPPAAPRAPATSPATAPKAGGGLSSLRDEMLDELNRLKKIMRGE